MVHVKASHNILKDPFGKNHVITFSPGDTEIEFNNSSHQAKKFQDMPRLDFASNAYWINERHRTREDAYRDVTIINLAKQSRELLKKNVRQRKFYSW